MNVYIHQNNETAGPFDEATIRGMLDSGQILLLTFARLEGETGWRPLSEIISPQRAAPAASPAPRAPAPAPPRIQVPQQRSPAPAAERAQVREQPRPSSAAAGPPVSQGKQPGTLKIQCPKCGQRILVDTSYAGMTGACPNCGGPVVIPAAPAPQSAPRVEPPELGPPPPLPAPPPIEAPPAPSAPSAPSAPPALEESTPQSPAMAAPSRPAAARRPAENDSPLERARGFAYRFSGLRPLQDFKISLLFSDVFKNRSKSDFDAFFNCGCPATTPDPAALSQELPRPWFYLRMLIFGGLILFALCFGYEKYQEPEILPCLMFGAAFLIPLCCAALFFELNVPRNVSIYQLAKLVVGGAIISLPVAWFIFAHTKPNFPGTLSADLLVEIAQALIAVALLRGAFPYRWILNGLLFGAAVSAGLAGLDSTRYMLYAFIDDMGRGDGKLTTFYSTLTNQLGYGLAPLCQVLWTAIITGALWRVKRDDPFGITLFFRKRFLRILVIVIVLQALWNSGMLGTEIWKFNLPSLAKIEKGLWVVSIIGTCYLALLLVQEGLRQVREPAFFDEEAKPESGEQSDAELAG